MKKKIIKHINHGINCCGCSACVYSCPINAIQMVKSDEGFMYPSINFDICTNCGICESSCPLNGVDTKPVISSWAFQCNNSDDLNRVASGGFFTSLAYNIIDKGGYVAGVIYNEQCEAVYYITNKKEEIKLFSSSKYSQANVQSIINDVVKIVKNGSLLLFSGTPCQVAGIKKIINKEYDNFITLDVACRGIPSPYLWEEYLKMQEAIYNSKVISANHRDKSLGYHNGVLKLNFENTKSYIGSVRVDFYSNAFHRDYCSRESCYHCRFKGYNRCSDFTAFDCWLPHDLNSKIKDNDKGYTGVYVRTNKAQSYIKEMQRGNMYMIDAAQAEKYTGGMLLESPTRPAERNTFYTDLINLGVDSTFDKYVCVSKYQKFKFFIKRILAYLHLLR